MPATWVRTAAAVGAAAVETAATVGADCVASAWTVMLGSGLRQMQTGKVQDYVMGVAVGVLLLLWWLGGAL